jgi:hypothetical protein
MAGNAATLKRVGIWIDDQQAILVYPHDDSPDIRVLLKSTQTNRVGGHDGGQFLSEVFPALIDCQEIIILGPAPAKDEFVHQLTMKGLTSATIRANITVSSAMTQATFVELVQHIYAAKTDHYAAANDACVVAAANIRGDRSSSLPCR